MSTQDPGRAQPSVTVVICAYTEDRWDLLGAAVDSVLDQGLQPQEVIVSIDHNRALFERCQQRWPVDGRTPDHKGVPIFGVENQYRGHLASARTTAALLATGDIVAFLDDDAAAEPTWLAKTVLAFDDPDVIAVGGAPHPVFLVPRPRWFPRECDWVP